MRAARALGAFAVAASLAGSSGCSLVFAPTIVDAGPDAFQPPDATWDEPDAFEDDVFVPVDAWVRPPPELCDNDADDDGDLLADCNDPDCFGEAVCCNPSVGTDLAMGVLFGGMLVREWSDRDLSRTPAGRLVTLGVAGAASFGALWRNYCVPLGSGGHFEVRLASTPRAGESATLVLSPAREPGPSGFLEELAIHIDDANHLTATRAGRAVSLRTAAECVDATGAFATLGAETSFFFDLVPGVSGGRSVLLATLSVLSSSGGCTSMRALFEDEVILAEDLVRTPEDASRSCQDSPGLYFGIEVRAGAAGSGGFAIAPLSGATPSVVLRPLECASPGVFSRSSVVLDREDVEDPGASHTLGGIGAPDLVYGGTSTGWALAYDASLEDRSEELFRRLTMSVGLGFGASADADAWAPSATSPVTGLGTRPREPSLTIQGVSDPILLWARETSTPGAYEIVRGLLDPTGSVLGGVTAVAPALDLCDSLREPTSALSYDAEGMLSGEWILARCDLEADSRLGLWRRPSGGAVTMASGDALRGSAIATRVIAADVLTARQDDAQFFALWVLARGPTDVAELHLFLADRVAADATPMFIPYAGNPILREGDGSLPACPAGESCRLTSLSVAQVAQAGADRLRFLFARSRTGTSAAYELVAAEQVALAGLDP